MDNPNDVVLDRKIQNGSRRITSLHVASVTLWLPCVETHLGGRLFCLDSLLGDCFVETHLVAVLWNIIRRAVELFSM